MYISCLDFCIFRLEVVGAKLVKKNIRICHECEGRIKKIRPEDRHFASRGLPGDDKR